jgi:hypothetical protein
LLGGEIALFSLLCFIGPEGIPFLTGVETPELKDPLLSGDTPAHPGLIKAVLTYEAHPDV